MKKYLCGMAALVMAIVFCSSCQKEVDDSFFDSPTSDSIYLSKYVEVDTTLSSGQDTVYVANYFYDSHKRISTYNYSDLSNVPIVIDGGEGKYYYNGSDTLPYMQVEKITMNGVVGSVDTILYSYNNGMVSKDTLTTHRITNNELMEESGMTYTMSGNNVSVQGQYWYYSPISPPLQTIYSGNVSIVFSTGNKITQTATSGIAQYEYSEMVYDNHPNPFYKIDVHYPVSGSVRNLSFDAAKNNILTLNGGTVPGNFSNQYSSAYVYRSDGYPLIVRGTDLLDPSFHVKGFFFYTSH